MLHSFNNKQVDTMRQIWSPGYIALQRNKERVASFTIERSISHCRAIASSWSRYRTVVSSSPHYRAITLSTSIQNSKVRRCIRKIHDPIRIPYIKNTHFTPVLQGRKNYSIVSTCLYVPVICKIQLSFLGAMYSKHPYL